MWNLWWTKWHWDWAFTEGFGFLPVTKITQVLCTHSCTYHNDGVVKYLPKDRTRLGTLTSISRPALKKFSLSLFVRQRITERHKNVSKLQYRKSHGPKKAMCTGFTNITAALQRYALHWTQRRIISCDADDSAVSCYFIRILCTPLDECWKNDHRRRLQ